MSSIFLGGGCTIASKEGNNQHYYIVYLIHIKGRCLLKFGRLNVSNVCLQSLD